MNKTISLLSSQIYLSSVLDSVDSVESVDTACKKIKHFHNKAGEKASALISVFGIGICFIILIVSKIS